MSQAATPSEIIDFFLDPRSYGHPVDRIEHQQTHVSHLFFAGDFVYKVKKPVNFGFLDFSTLAKRREAAIAELELNRRVAPDVYLDVAAVHRDADGALSFAAPTSVLEVAVVMKRLPDAQRLSNLIANGKATPEMMRKLGHLVADFHRRAESSPEIARFGSLAVVRHNWDENFEQTESFIGRTLSHETWSRTKEEIERFLRVYAQLFEQRVADGWVRDCHGDLQADDTFIDPASGEARVLDCIEFNQRFRYSDTLSDIAFLSMDMRNRGRPDLARAFLDAYYDRSADRRNPALLRFYESYRAYVRGKVRSFVIDQEGPSAAERRAAADEARRFFDLSLTDAAGLRPRLVLFAGIMGSGKTRQSAELGRRTGTVVLHSDELRKKLAGLEPEEEQKVPFGEGIYSTEWTERTYVGLIDAAHRELAQGNSIILDASWSSGERRAAARAAAAQYEAIFAIVECGAPDDVLSERLSKPHRRVTDGRIELLDAQRASYQPPADDEADLLIRIDTSGDFEEATARVHEALFN